jgi:hypothetical protein
MDPAELTEERVAEIIAGVKAYYRQERALFFPASDPLTPELNAAVQPYFPNALLERIRTVTLKGARIPPPPFYSEAMAMSSGNFPDFVHLASITYIDVIVFHEDIGLRPLFHGLVHATQMALLGVDRYVELYVRGFAKTRSWITIPLEGQAFQLDTRFAMSAMETFSVEDEVKSWAKDGRY